MLKLKKSRYGWHKGLILLAFEEGLLKLFEFLYNMWKSTKSRGKSLQIHFEIVVQYPWVETERVFKNMFFSSIHFEVPFVFLRCMLFYQI